MLLDILSDIYMRLSNGVNLIFLSLYKKINTEIMILTFKLWHLFDISNLDFEIKLTLLKFCRRYYKVLTVIYSVSSTSAKLELYNISFVNIDLIKGIKI